MLRNFYRGVTTLFVCLLAIDLSGTAAWRQQSPARPNEVRSRTVARIGDYAITVGELEQVIESHPAGSIPSRQSKLRLVENLIDTKLFAQAARSAKLDEAEDFPRAKQEARENALAYAYFLRYVQPKFSEQAARKYFDAHRDEYHDFSFSRTRIKNLLRDRALTETNQTLMKEFHVKQRDDVLRDLDLRDPEDPSLVLARIGPRVVTVEEIKRRAAPTDVATFEGKKFLLDAFVLERVYALAAERAGLLDDPVVRRALEWSEERLLAKRYRRFVEGKVTIEDARRYYQAHPEEFRWPDQLRLRRIVVATEREALAVKARLERGDSFQQVARAYSTDRGSAAEGGDAAWVRKGQLYPQVEKVAFQLKPKHISQPIKTPGGYYIIRVDERLGGALKPFDQISSNVLHRLKTRAVEVERERLERLYKVTINHNAL